MTTPRLGAQLFINRGETPERIFSLVRGMAEARMKIIRLFCFWDLVEPRPGCWDWSAMDAAFEAAEAEGLKVVPTSFAMCPPGWMRQTTANQEAGELDDPALFAAGMDYLTRLVERYRGHPALDSWLLWNEPGLEPAPSDRLTARFRIFLRELYQNIEALNDRYYAQFENFEQIECSITTESMAVPVASPVQRMDWWRFRLWHLSEIVGKYARHVRELDPHHPVHVNPRDLGSSLCKIGHSVWRLGQEVDFLGCSAHPVWHSTRFPPDRITQSIGYFTTLCRDASKNPDKTWVTELQAGPAVFSGRSMGTATATALKSWIYEGVGRGAEAVVFWSYSGRIDGGEVGEWTMIDQQDRPTARLLAAQECAAFLEDHDDLLKDTLPIRPTVRILSSEASMIHGFEFGNGDRAADPRNAHRGTDAATGAFNLLDDLDVDIGLIDEVLLADPERMAGTKVLVVPDALALAEGTIPRLLDFARGGGLVIADGLTGFLDPWSRLNRQDAEDLEALFGASIRDIEPGFTDSIPGDPEVPAWFNRVLFTEPGTQVQVTGRWGDGEPAILRNSMLEKGGGAIRFGSHLFQQYFAFPDDCARQLVKSWLPEDAVPVAARKSTVPGLRMGRLRHPEGTVLLAWNESEDSIRLDLLLRGVAPAPETPLPENLLPGQAAISLLKK